jgi:hypothetical protein
MAVASLAWYLKLKSCVSGKRLVENLRSVLSRVVFLLRFAHVLHLQVYQGRMMHNIEMPSDRMV